MKAAVLALFAALCGSAHAQDFSACYSIGDADARTYCLARARRTPEQCYAIQRADLRSACLAEVRR